MEGSPQSDTLVNGIIKGYMSDRKDSRQAEFCRELLSGLHQLDQVCSSITQNEANEQTWGNNLPA